MEKSKYIKYGAFLLALVVVALSSFAGYMIFKPDKKAGSLYASPETIEAEIQSNRLLDDSITEQTFTSHNPQPKILATTNMVYEYYYTSDGKTERTEELPPYFMIDMTEQSLKESFSEWQIVKFTSDEVVMQKNIEGKSSQYYILGIQDGYVAVFYEEPINGTSLKELTETPIAALSDEELIRLKAGIHVMGNDQLIKALEDYGS